VSLRSKEELFPVEDDPVGEFLERKKGGIALVEEETEEIDPTSTASGDPLTTETDIRSEPVGEGEVVDKDAVSGEKVAATSPEANEQAKPASGMVSISLDAAGASQGTEEKKEIAVAENEESEVKVEAIAKDEHQAIEPGVQRVVEADKSEKKSSQDGENVDSLLDVFRSEESESDGMSSLIKNLGDMNVYSLLEEGKQIAAKMKLKKKGAE
jgi:hypothetical protein